jgi:hypothetical protein
MYFNHVICELQQYELQIIVLHMVIGINLVNQILLGIIEIVHGEMIGNHQDEEMHEVQMIGEYFMRVYIQLLG